MKVVVIGLGSMGKRRLRLLKSNFNFVDLVGVDLDEERRKIVKNEFDINTYGL